MLNIEMEAECLCGQMVTASKDTIRTYEFDYWLTDGSIYVMFCECQSCGRFHLIQIDSPQTKKKLEEAAMYMRKLSGLKQRGYTGKKIKRYKNVTGDLSKAIDIARAQLVIDCAGTVVVIDGREWRLPVHTQSFRVKKKDLVDGGGMNDAQEGWENAVSGVTDGGGIPQ